MLKEEISGESASTAELDIKATAYIPENYIESPAGRMDCYKQIAEIRTVADYKRVCLSIEENYGPMPNEVLNLLIIAVMKAYASRLQVSKIGVSSKAAYLEFSAAFRPRRQKTPCGYGRICAGHSGIYDQFAQNKFYASCKSGKNYARNDKIFKICGKFHLKFRKMICYTA